MANLKVNTVSGIGTEGTVFDGGLKFRSENYMTLPKGTTTERIATSSGISTETGSIRYNTDSNKMECYIGDKWMIVSTSQALEGVGGRGVSCGGASPGASPYARVNTMEYVTIATAGNSVDFGDLTSVCGAPGCCASTTRGLIGGGNNPVNDRIEVITIASAGNSTDTGNLTQARTSMASFSNQVRGIWAGGSTPTQVNTIDFVSISSNGDASDFGDIISHTIDYIGGGANPTRGYVAGGNTPSKINNIQFITIMSTGNALDFGDLTVSRRMAESATNTTRGVIIGGETPSDTNVIDFITIPTTGNAQDFGDLDILRRELNAVFQAPTRAAFGGGYAAPTGIKSISQLNIIQKGNAFEFGDLLATVYSNRGLSNSHGGL